MGFKELSAMSYADGHRKFAFTEWLREWSGSTPRKKGLDTRYYSIAQYDKKAARRSHHGLELSILGLLLAKGLGVTTRRFPLRVWVRGETCQAKQFPVLDCFSFCSVWIGRTRPTLLCGKSPPTIPTYSQYKT